MILLLQSTDCPCRPASQNVAQILLIWILYRGKDSFPTEAKKLSKGDIQRAISTEDVSTKQCKQLTLIFEHRENGLENKVFKHHRTTHLPNPVPSLNSLSSTSPVYDAGFAPHCQMCACDTVQTCRSVLSQINFLMSFNNDVFCLL